MPPERDLNAFEARATTYEEGWRGRMHHEIADRTADLVLSTNPLPRRLLDIGCGTGHLLRTLAQRLPDIDELNGIDPAPSMIEVATNSTDDARAHYSVGVAEHLPYSDVTFDVIVTTTSFDHWADQQAGLHECARVLVPGGTLIVVDMFSTWLVPTLLGGRRRKARTKRRANVLLEAAGFGALAWHDVYAVIIKAVTATTTPDPS